MGNQISKSMFVLQYINETYLIAWAMLCVGLFGHNSNCP
ncbi:hypothetical protein AALB_1876 [Agarivorans albus MKT 106]|uniref:Uncharacterized protein n=1 Tax=Agarivorans albus MKT 106 TaxID=1331007 RepID=R9PT48_AGAAL|nr:hypothetical protein AALB_1876 [Agarivorans albus MKT 106]